MCTQCMLTLTIHKSSSEMHIHVQSQVIFVSCTYLLTACWHCQVRIKSSCQVHIYLLHVDTASAKSELNHLVITYLLTACWHCQVRSHLVMYIYYWLLHFFKLFHSPHADSDTAQSQVRNVSLVWMNDSCLWVCYWSPCSHRQRREWVW